MSLDAFQDWKTRADECNLLEVAQRYGAVMKRAGREYKGACPNDGGRDRFSLSPTAHKWYCRGGQCGGRGAIGMVQHIAGLSFLEACEALTGEPNPSGKKARPLSEAEQAERNRKRLAAEAAQRAREAEQARYLQDTREAAQAIWDASQPVPGTLAQLYLNKRGIVLDQYPDVLRFHPWLPYPGGARIHALICRVDDVSGQLAGIWRVYLASDGGKAGVPSPKLGLGPAGGGAVRIGGMGRKIAIAEGIESALGYWLLTGQRHPTWAALSTAGMIGFEVPLGVEHVVIAPDGDRPIKRQGFDFTPTIPAGRKAAEALRKRLLVEGITTTIAAEPPASRDYLDLWNARQGSENEAGLSLSNMRRALVGSGFVESR